MCINTIIFNIIRFLIFIRNIFFWYYYKFIDASLIIDGYNIKTSNFVIKYVYRTNKIPYIDDILKYFDYLTNIMIIYDDKDKIYMSYDHESYEIKLTKDDIVKYVDRNDPIDIKSIIDSFKPKLNTNGLNKLNRLRARKLQTKNEL